MRGELCIGSASFLSFVAVLLLIFVHVGQINTSTVPRGVSMVSVNVSGYGASLAAAFAPDPIQGLYTNNATAPLEAGAGLRQLYKFGLYGYCGYVNGTQGVCTNRTAGRRFEPFNALTADMGNVNYTIYSNAIFSNNIFENSGQLGQQSNAAYYLLLLGAVGATIALITYVLFSTTPCTTKRVDYSGVIKRPWAFLLSTGSAVISSIFVLAGASIWTSIIQQCHSVENILVGQNHVPLGVIVSTGPGVYLAWASFACLLVSVIPYMISCCTFRG